MYLLTNRLNSRHPRIVVRKNKLLFLTTRGLETAPLLSDGRTDHVELSNQIRPSREWASLYYVWHRALLVNAAFNMDAHARSMDDRSLERSHRRRFAKVGGSIGELISRDLICHHPPEGRFPSVLVPEVRRVFRVGSQRVPFVAAEPVSPRGASTWRRGDSILKALSER